MRPRLIPREDGQPSTPLSPGQAISYYHRKGYSTAIIPTSISTDSLSPTDISLIGSVPGASPTSQGGDYDINLSGISFPSSIAAEDQQEWGRFSMGVKAAVVIAAIFGIVAIIIASIWFCCGRPRRRRLKAEEEDMRLQRRRMAADARDPSGVARDTVPALQVPLRTLSGNERRESMAPAQARGAVGRAASRLSRRVSLRGYVGTDAPPRYEEVVPPAHQRLAGGMVRRGDLNHITPMEEEDGMGVVADGKTPLSEIPFEDVVPTPSSSGSGSSSSSSGSHEEGGRDFEYRHAMGGGNTTGHTNA